MAENGLDTLNEFLEVWVDLSGLDYPCFLRAITRKTVQDSNPIITNYNITSTTRIASEDNIKMLSSAGYSLNDKLILSMWGGTLDSLGRSSIIEPILQRCLDNKGGIIYNEDHFKIIGIKKGLLVESIAMIWFLVCEGMKPGT